MPRKKTEAPDIRATPEVVIITGLSGSGMSAATNAFEDLGYFSVDSGSRTGALTFNRIVSLRDTWARLAQKT